MIFLVLAVSSKSIRFTCEKELCLEALFKALLLNPMISQICQAKQNFMYVLANWQTCKLVTGQPQTYSETNCVSGNRCTKLHPCKVKSQPDSG